MGRGTPATTGRNQTWSTGSGNDSAKILFDISLSPSGDFDGDGIPDSVERFGIREVETGNVVADLTNFGSVEPQAADPCRKTILIETDFMTKKLLDGHTHRPQDAALKEIQDAFGKAPVKASPNCPYPGFGTKDGVQLMIERGNSIPEKADLRAVRSREHAR